MTTFKGIRNQIKEQYNGYREKAKKAIQEREESIRNYSTATRWNQYQNGTITRDQAIEYATKRMEKEYQKKEAAALDRLEKAAASPELETVTISVEWHRSRVWGYNPTVTAEVQTVDGFERFTGSASGCGYDKESAAVADALYNCYPVIKALCEKKEASGLFERNNHNAIAYGAGYDAIPALEGGVGMSSLESVFNACGYVIECRNHTKTTDFYYFVKKEGGAA